MLLAVGMGTVWAVSAEPTLVLDPSRLGPEPWRLLTWPLAHLDGRHLLLDLIPFLVLGVFVELRGARRFWALCGASTLAAGVLWCLVDSRPLAGASGLDSALFTAAALDLLFQNEGRVARWFGLAALLLFAVKVAAEAVTGQAHFLGGAGAWLVHTVAALAALAMWAAFRRRRSRVVS